MPLEFLPIGPEHIDILSEMNMRLLIDENHRRSAWPMERIRERMAGFLRDGYTGMIFQLDGQRAGYVLWREEPEHLYIRQFYIEREFRRRGIGRTAMQWLRENKWNGHKRLRLDVLCDNSTGINFWRRMGFRDYCTTMELEQS